MSFYSRLPFILSCLFVGITLSRTIRGEGDIKIFVLAVALMITYMVREYKSLDDEEEMKWER